MSEFKYLGDFINEKGNNDNLIQQRIKNVYKKIIIIKAICKEVILGKYEIETFFKLYESIFLSSLLFNCQSWQENIVI